MKDFRKCDACGKKARTFFVPTELQKWNSWGSLSLCKRCGNGVRTSPQWKAVTLEDVIVMHVLVS